MPLSFSLAHMFCTEYNDPINEKNPVLTIPDINLLFLLGAMVLDFQRMESELLATHQRTDIKVTPEGIQSNLDIIDIGNPGQIYKGV